MMKRILPALILVLVLQGAALAADAGFLVTYVYEADDQGKMLQSIPYAGGWIVLYGDGTYKMQLHVYDEGTYQLAPANQKQPFDAVYFFSKKGYRLYGIPGQNGQVLAVWLYKTDKGNNVWVNAIASPNVPGLPQKSGQSQAGSQGSQGAGGAQKPGNIQPVAPGSGELIRNGAFTEVAMYGATSAPTYYWYDRGSGSYNYDQKGIVFHPNGTYWLKAEFGGLLQEERGRYRIDGNTVTVQFSDGSALELTIEQNGRKLHWYDKGILLTEFFFLGVAK